MSGYSSVLKCLCRVNIWFLGYFFLKCKNITYPNLEKQIQAYHVTKTQNQLPFDQLLTQDRTKQTNFL